MPKKKQKNKVNVDDLKGGWEPQVLKGLQALRVKFDYDFGYETKTFNYTIVHGYTPDFPIHLKNGKIFYIEAKGYWDAADRAKIKHVKKQNPEADIRMLFQKDQKLHKASKTRYSDYCERHGITYAVGGIPEEWFSNS